MTRCFLFIMAVLLMACGPVTSPQDYDQSCTQDEDCAVVFLHRDCECEHIGAVNISELPQVERDNAAAQALEWCPTGKVQCDVAAQVAICEQGMCQNRNRED